MKKYLYIGAMLFAALFVACNDDIDDKLDGIDDLDKPWDLTPVDLTLVDADYNAVAVGLRANKTHEDSVLANQIAANRAFSTEIDPHVWVPYLLAKKYTSPDVGKSANVTFKYNDGAGVLDISAKELYTLASADYAIAWGNPSVDAFTPAKSAESNLPAILLNKFGTQPEGIYKSLSYYYSKEEPIPSSVIGDIHHEEGFENNPSGAGSGKKLDVAGWLNVDLSGSIFWQCRTYSSNNYTQVSSYNTHVLNDVWLISPQVDLTSATSPWFSFDIVVGNYNATCLKVLISDNFDGNQANILTATWTDITSNFTLPTPASGYSQWESAGSLALDSYNGKKVYIAFRYEGDDLNATKKTTTYQLDNFKVYEEVLGLEVAEKSKVYDLYVSTGSAWKKSTNDNLIILQPEDYTAMNNKTYLAVKDAPTYLPIFLNQKFPYLESGASKTILYNISATESYADTFTKTATGWEIITRTDRFIYALTDQSTQKKEWIFDPTLTVVMVREDYNIIVDYVKAHQGTTTPSLINTERVPGEFYYGFSAYYSNVTYRDKDRANDPSYPSSASGGTRKEQLEFMNRRVEEGLKDAYLPTKFPDAQPLINGVEQEAKVTVLIYDVGNPVQNVSWTYKFKCVGNKQWEFIERVSDKGEVNKAGEY